MQTMDYSGYKCVPLENGSLRLLVTQSVGPRIISFGFKGGDNLFAELPDFVTELPGGGVFHFYGGHRLWAAPESFDITYMPDDEPVEVNAMENGLQVIQGKQAATGLQKSLKIVFSDETQVTVTHRISNQGQAAITFAPWAITQFKKGGVAILPQAQNDAGVLPNRSLALWSYSNMSDPNVVWGRNFVLVHARMRSAFKVGFPNPRGWLAYWLNGTMFVKRAEYDEGAQYYDFGSSSESYCNDQFLELETLAPIKTIGPGEAATHVETWDLFGNIELPRNETGVQALVETLGLA